MKLAENLSTVLRVGKTRFYPCHSRSSINITIPASAEHWPDPAHFSLEKNEAFIPVTIAAPASPEEETAPVPTVRSQPKHGGRGSSARCLASVSPPPFAITVRSLGCSLPDFRKLSKHTLEPSRTGSSFGGF